MNREREPDAEPESVCMHACIYVCKGGEYEGGRTLIDKWRLAGWVGRVVVGGG